MRAGRMVLGLIVLLVLSPLIMLLFFKKVEPGNIGVRQLRWGGGGVEAEDFGTGFKLGISGLHRWYFLPRRTHFLHFTRARIGRDGISEVVPPLELRTKDGNVVTVEFSVPYRIIEGKAHEIVRAGRQAVYRERVKEKVKDVLRVQLAELASEDFVQTEKRLARALSALEILNQDLTEYHVLAETILIRHISFAANYEEKLQAKQFLRQKAYLDEALAEQATQETIVNLVEKDIQSEELRIDREWDRDIQSMRSDYQVQIARIESEARMNAVRIRAEGSKEQVIAQARGQLALEQAAALRDELRNEALNSVGGRILLALEAVEGLTIPEVTLNADDPRVPMILDLGRMTELLVGEGGE